MKRLLSIPKRYLIRGLSGLILLLILATPLNAAPARTDIQLFNIAYDAYQNQDWVKAAMYFTAYIERDPDAMRQNPGHAQQVREAWVYAEDAANFYRTKSNQLERQLADCKRQCSDQSSVSTIVSGLTNRPRLDRPSTVVHRTYPLVCRGGGDMYFQYLSGSGLSGKPQVWLQFEKASRGVGNNWEFVDQLGPGQCTWVDRAIAANEPSRLVMLNPLVKEDSFAIHWQHGQVRGISSAMPYLNQLQNSDGLQVFQAYNDGKGNFITTHLGLAPPQVISPLDGAAFDHYPRTTTLRWKSLPNVTRYQVQVDCFHCCEANRWCTDVAGRENYGISEVRGTEHTFNFVGAQPGRWRVWAIDQRGQAGPKSPWQEFTYSR